MAVTTRTLPAFGVGADLRGLAVRYAAARERFHVPLEPLGSIDRETWSLRDDGETIGEWAVARSQGYALIAATHDGDEIGEVTRDAYTRMLETVRALGTSNLVRVWNYVRDINEIENGLERYQRFSVGRFEALASAGFALNADLPAASAVGSHGGPQLTIVALASVTPGQQIENPRQVSAWAYPSRYGPRSPSFSRATIERVDAETRLWISGTASIVGHESVHTGDPEAQMRETLANIAAVIDAAGMPGGLSRLTMLKAYVRHRADLSMFREMLEAAVPGVPVIWLEADICRAELLLEIEGCASWGAESVRTQR